MSARRQKVSDEEIFAGAHRAMTRYGPHELTLAHIAAESGVTSGLLVQRFGSKRALLLALSARFAKSAAPVFRALREAHPAPLAALRAYAASMAGLAATPDALSRNLAYLQIDLTDHEFRRNLRANARATRKEIQALLRSAVEAGELKPGADPRLLARTVESLLGGSLMSWACYRQGSAETWIRQDLESLLQPYLTAAGRRSSPKS